MVLAFFAEVANVCYGKDLIRNIVTCLPFNLIDLLIKYFFRMFSEPIKKSHKNKFVRKNIFAFYDLPIIPKSTVGLSYSRGRGKFVVSIK